VCAVAEGEGVLLAIEGHVLSPLDTPRRVRELFDAVGSPALKFNTDPVNFIRTLQDVYDTPRILNELFDLLGKETLVAHAKDVSVGDPLVLHIEEVLLGTGYLDYPLFLRRFQACSPDGWIEIEHLPDEKVPLARQALLQKAAEAGVMLEY
jgi:sugar phosphate isomerase/epimerase